MKKVARVTASMKSKTVENGIVSADCLSYKPSITPWKDKDIMAQGRVAAGKKVSKVIKVPITPLKFHSYFYIIFKP